MTSKTIRRVVEQEILDFNNSRLAPLLKDPGPYVIKFVQSRWANMYETAGALKISETPALTWGTATYVTPIVFPLSSALYGRVGLVASCDPKRWRVFDATVASGRSAYVQWARAQPIYSELLLTVHSTQANQLLRNRFREEFRIDCVLFQPDQEAESHTNRVHHIWMAVTDWTSTMKIDNGMSQCFSDARFAVLIDEDFRLQDQGLPIQVAGRQLEAVTERLHASNPNAPEKVGVARCSPNLPHQIASVFQRGGYLHVYIEP